MTNPKELIRQAENRQAQEVPIPQMPPQVVPAPIPSTPPARRPGRINYIPEARPLAPPPPPAPPAAPPQAPKQYVAVPREIRQNTIYRQLMENHNRANSQHIKG